MTVEGFVARPAPAVFGFVADSRNDPRWCRLVANVVQVAGDGPGPDARYTFEQVVSAGRSVPGTITVTDFDPARRIAWHVDDAARTYDITMEFSDAVGGTRLVQTSHPRFKGRYRWIPGPYMRRMIRRGLAGQFRSLARALDAAPP